jgi:LPS O-antigen subunit length determinant protein (WzzB/FepE family)
MTDQNQKNTSVSQVEEDEIDLIAIAKTLWQGRKTILKTTLIFMALGLFVAIFSEKEYTASTTFVPQTSDSKIGGNLGGLASLAGINLGSMNSGSEISPSLYPQIINSIPFQLEMLQTPLTIADQKEKITFEEYYKNHYRPSVLGYIKKYTIGLPGLFLKAIKGDPEALILNEGNQTKVLSITQEEYKLVERLIAQLVLEVNLDDGFVSISGNMPEAIASAELTLKAQELLQQYVINFKIKKSKEQLNFIQDRYGEKEKEFKAIQQKLALYRDQNRNVNSPIAKITLQKLESEYDLAYGIYSELAKQLETQQIQVKEDTPIFMVLEPVSVPLERFKPKRMMILSLWFIAGLLCGFGFVLGKKI